MSNKNISIQINITKNKMISLFVLIMALFGLYSFAGFVSVVDAQSNGGVTVIQEEDSAPVGSVIMWASSTPPEGWLEMNGQSTAGYSELAAIVGSNVPDLRGKFVRAYDNGAGIDSGRSVNTSQAQEFKGLWIETNQTGGSGSGTYTHDQQYYKNIGSATVGHLGVVNFTGGWSNPSAGIKIGFGNEEVRPVNVSLMFIIKATSTN